MNFSHYCVITWHFLITGFSRLSSLEVLHRHTYRPHVFSKCIIKLYWAGLSSVVVSGRSTGHSFVQSSLIFLEIRGWFRFYSFGGSASIIYSSFGLVYIRLIGINIFSNFCRVDCCKTLNVAELFIV